MLPTVRKVWRLLVPREWSDGNPIPVAHHRAWDTWVCGLTSGITLCPTIKGRWGNPSSPGADLVVEDMIPVEIACTDQEITGILEYTGRHYRQEEVIAWMISDTVVVWSKE